MKYFLDFGTHFFDTNHEGNTGKGPNGLINTFYNQGYMNNDDWIVKTYEPSKSIFEANIPYLEDVKAKFYKFEAINAAILDYTGKVEFKMMWGNPAGSNCVSDELYMRDVVDESKRNDISSYEVDCIDINEIIKNIISENPDAEIHIKCDIEGSEFKVLPRLLELENLRNNLKRIFIEWHERLWKLNSEYNNICNIKSKIIQEFSSKGIEILTHW